MLTFDEVKHLYFWDGKPVPSVTQIINEWMEISVYGIKYYTNRYTGTTISADVFRAAGEFGVAIHAGAKILAEGRMLDFSALHSSLDHPLHEFIRWMNDYEPIIHLVEQSLYSAKYRYAGTFDLICTINRRLCVVDIKTGEYGAAGIQTAGYEQLYREHTKRGALHMQRYVLHLPKDGGSYQFLKEEDTTDFSCFLGLLFTHQQMERRK